MGGASIFRVAANDPNLSVIIETLTEGGQKHIMAQKFIPEIVNGDKRILLIDGELVSHALARVPAVGESRGNLAAGGSGVAQELTDRDRWICSQVGPTVKKKRLLFVGLDVIGDYLTEINVTSPTCVREIDRAFDLDIAGDLMDCIQLKLLDLTSNRAS
jgi:glutathione synthase